MPRFLESFIFIYYRKGSNWKAIEGDCEGTTATCCARIESDICAFSHPIDAHLASRGIQGWPKLHVEIFAVNALNNCWPIGYARALRFI